jgi:hypothetical protein
MLYAAAKASTNCNSGRAAYGSVVRRLAGWCSHPGPGKAMSSQASDPLVRLKRELGKCADAFDPAAEDAGRASAIMSLVAIGEFLTAVFGTGLSTPLRQLQYAPWS